MTPSHRRLTADERSWLSVCARMVATAPDPAALVHARAAAVAAAQRYRWRGAAWDEIAEALGIPVAVLQDWRGATGPAKPAPGVLLPELLVPGLRGPPVSLVTWLGRVAGDRHGVLVALGNPKPGDNDFSAEAAAIQTLLEDPYGIDVAVRPYIELSQIRGQLEARRPAILHLAAHADFGTVHLTLDEVSVAVLSEDLLGAIRAAAWRPWLVVFNCCESDPLARYLAAPGSGSPAVQLAIGWRGRLTDDQARIFTRQLYRRLVTGRAVGEVFDDAQRAVTATWPDQAVPRLYGDAGTTFR